MFKSQDRALQIDFIGAFSRAHQKSAEIADGSYGRLAAIRRFSNNGYLSGSLTNVDRGFDLRDAGYLARPDYSEIRSEGGRNWDSKWKSFRNWGFYASATYAQDQAGHAFRRNADGRFSTELSNAWKLYAGGGLDLATEDDRELRTFFASEKKYLQRETSPYVTAGVASDLRAWTDGVLPSRTVEARGPRAFSSRVWNVVGSSCPARRSTPSTPREPGAVSWPTAPARSAPSTIFRYSSANRRMTRCRSKFHGCSTDVPQELDSSDTGHDPGDRSRRSSDAVPDATAASGRDRCTRGRILRRPRHEARAAHRLRTAPNGQQRT